MKASLLRPVTGRVVLTRCCNAVEGGVVGEVTTVVPVVVGVVVGVVVAGVVGGVVGMEVAVVVVTTVQPVPFWIHGPPTRPWGWVSNTNTNLMST